MDESPPPAEGLQAPPVMPADKGGKTAPPGPPPPAPYEPWRRIGQHLDDIGTQLWILEVLAQRNEPPAAVHLSHERVLKVTALLREMRALVPKPHGAD